MDLRKSILLALGLFMCGLVSAGSELNTKPKLKVGLVLSGGGAKGFAHIGVIKALEEMGIKPDVVTGTSMGAVVGGLYSMGYSVEEMEELSRTIVWEDKITNTISLSDVNMIEKSYYGNFFTELDITKSGVHLPSGLIEGQNLFELLAELSRPVHGINDFTKFPIPFTCVATDIEKGEPVSLNSGNVANAIRASMAIPSAFTPVEIDSMLLIDGGWTRNLPVQEAIDMGANFIIAVDVSSGLKGKEELKSAIAILDQTAWMLSDHDTKQQIELSDIYIHPEVTSFSTFDFTESDTIIQLGYESAIEQREEISILAKKLGVQGPLPPSDEPAYHIDNYNFSRIEVLGNKKSSDEFILGRLDLKRGKKYEPGELSKRIHELYGSLYYQKVGYEVLPLTDSTQLLRINVVESNPAKLQLSIYYDNENGIGLNANLALRNVLLKNSRFLFTTFISENPVFDLKYVKYGGIQQKTMVFADVRFAWDSRFTWKNFYNQEAGYNYRDLYANIGFGYTPSHNQLTGLTFGYAQANAVPNSNPDTVINSWFQASVPAKAFYTWNSLNKAVFPTRGFRLVAEAKYHLDLDHKIRLKPGFSQDQVDQVESGTQVDPYLLFNLSYKHYIPLAGSFSLFVYGEMQLPSQTDVGFNDHLKIGGVAPILFSGTPFFGLRRGAVNSQQAASASFGFQWRVVGDFYLRGKVNYLNTEYPMTLLNPNLSAVEFATDDGQMRTEIMGFGGELAYKSPLGPIRLLLHQNQYSDKLIFFLSIGYNIFRTDGYF